MKRMKNEDLAQSRKAAKEHSPCGPLRLRGFARELCSGSVLALVITTLFVAQDAAAHFGAPEGRWPFLVEGELIGGGTTWGIVRKAEDRWLRVCEEAIEEPPAFYYRQPSSGRLLLARSDGLWLTDDGCSLDAKPSVFDDARPSLLAEPRDLPTTLYVATSSSTGDNGLFLSTDEGQTFTPTSLQHEDVSFRSLAVSDDGEKIYLGGIYLDSRLPVVFVSLDGADTFEPKSPWPESVAAANVLGIDPGTGEVALTLLDPDVTGSTLALASGDLATSTTLAEFEGVVSDFLVHDDAWLVIEGRQRYFRRKKGDAEFTLVDGGPTRCLLKLPGDERVWGCGQPFQNGHFLVSDDGVSFTPVLPFLDVVEHRCPPGTLGAERCAYLFQGDAGVIEEPADDDAGGGGGGARVERPGEEPAGCPCSGGGGGDVPLLTLLVGLGLLGRRRRR